MGVLSKYGPWLNRRFYHQVMTIMTPLFLWLLALGCARTTASPVLRELFVDGGCPNVGDPCYSMLNGIYSTPGIGGTCAGTGSGSTYLPAYCNYTNATQISSTTFILNGTCSTTTVWPAAIYNTTCDPGNPMACQAPSGSLTCGQAARRCVYQQTTGSSVGDPCLDTGDCQTGFNLAW